MSRNLSLFMISLKTKKKNGSESDQVMKEKLPLRALILEFFKPTELLLPNGIADFGLFRSEVR